MHSTPIRTPQPPREVLMSNQRARLDSVIVASRRDELFGWEEES
jgi:hypothetical protein